MAYTDSAPVQTRLDLQGVWIMDPGAGGQASARHYPYGANQREEVLDVMSQATHYVGRPDPVTDYGEHESYAVSVTVDIPYGPTWRGSLDALAAFVAGRRTIHFRDNRGRALYGELRSLKRKDVAWGTQASFTVERRAYAVERMVV